MLEDQESTRTSYSAVSIRDSVSQCGAGDVDGRPMSRGGEAVVRGAFEGVLDSRGVFKVVFKGVVDSSWCILATHLQFRKTGISDHEFLPLRRHYLEVDRGC